MAWVVTLPEQLPVTEGLELIEGLEATRVPVGGVLLNQRVDDPFTPAERAALDRHLRHAPLCGAIAYRRLGAMARAEARLRDLSPVAVHPLPLLDTDAVIADLADHLAEVIT